MLIHLLTDHLQSQKVVLQFEDEELLKEGELLKKMGMSVSQLDTLPLVFHHHRYHH